MSFLVGLKKAFLISLFLAAMDSVQGCAAFFGKRSPQTVYIETLPGGAAVYFNKIYQCTTPCYIALSRAPFSAALVLKKDGFADRTMPVDEIARGALGPALSGTIGSLLDPGARQAGNYVPHYRFSLNPLGNPEGAQPAWMRVGSDSKPDGSWNDAGPTLPRR